MKKYFFFLLLWNIVHMGYGQINLGFNLQQPISLSEETSFALLYENPSLVHMMAKDSSAFRYENWHGQPFHSTNGIQSLFQSANTTGDYLFHQGNQSLTGGVYAQGEKHYSRIGTLYGSASYLQENNKEVLLNYAVNPWDYFPYLVSDTMSMGKLRKEIYRIKGGFGFNYRKTYWGIYGEYEGIVSSKQTDPKLSAYNSWFKLTLGMGKATQNFILSGYLAPEFNRQRISSGDYKNSSIKYFQFYGFGEWSRKESKSGYNYDRMMYIKGVKINTAIKKILHQKDEWNYMGYINYHYQHMNTEENSFKKLFNTHTHRINGYAELSKRVNRWNYQLMFSGGYSTRKGTENIYENKEVSEEQGLYDYKKVGENHLYQLHESYSQLKFKAITSLSPSQELHLGTGGKYLTYKETYISPRKKIENKMILPSLELTYYAQIKRHKLKVQSLWETKIAVSNVCENPVLHREQEIIIQQSYIPYLIRGENAQSFQINTQYGYLLKKHQTLGAGVSFTYYTRNKINPEIISPLISASHKQATIACSLFYLF